MERENGFCYQCLDNDIGRVKCRDVGGIRECYVGKRVPDFSRIINGVVLIVERWNTVIPYADPVGVCLDRMRALGLLK